MKGDIITLKSDVCILKQDVGTLKSDVTILKSDFSSLKSDVSSIKTEIQLLNDAVRNLYDANKEWKDEIIRHFDVVAENIRHDLLGANRDEIEVLKNSKSDHEQRIVHLEKRAGIAV